jgi:hypothetical protein
MEFTSKSTWHRRRNRLGQAWAEVPLPVDVRAACGSFNPFDSGRNFHGESPQGAPRTCGSVPQVEVRVKKKTLQELTSQLSTRQP